MSRIGLTAAMAALLGCLSGCGGSAPPPTSSSRPDGSGSYGSYARSSGSAATDSVSAPDDSQAISPRNNIRAQASDYPPSAQPGSAAPPDDAGGDDFAAGDDAPTAESPSYPMAAAPEEGDHLTVRLFYATDRKPLSQPQVTARTYVERFYPMAMASGVTALLIFAAPRFLKRRLSTGLLLLGLVSTAALGVAAVWACWLIHEDYYALRNEFGRDRGELSVGTCDVSIPLSHETGELESPSLLRFEVRPDPAKHIVFEGATALRPDAFYAQMQERVAGSPQRDALVFVHGFDNTFEDAVRRTAQLAFDLRFEGAAICYSWPSQGGLLKYFVDESNVEWTVPHLKKFLTEVAARSGATRIHLIAHSMGNRALTNALRSLAQERVRPEFHELLLTAPDIDAEVFKRDVAPVMARVARRVTLYASSTDRALALSRTVHGAPRAGDSGSELIVLPHLDTVDVTAVDTSLIGHSYYDRSESVLSDMYEVLHSSQPPARRRWLRQKDQNGLPYWVFDPDAAAAQPDQPTRR